MFGQCCNCRRPINSLSPSPSKLYSNSQVQEARIKKVGRSSSRDSVDSAKSSSQQAADPLSSGLDGSDPLSQFAAQAAIKPRIDPLSAAAADPLSGGTGIPRKDSVSIVKRPQFTRFFFFSI